MCIRDRVKNIDFADIQKFASLKHLKKGDMLGRVIIVDGNHAIMAMTHDKETHPSQDFALWSQSSHFAGDFLNTMFNMVWDKL
mgnify:CR=1 FL=1